MFKIVGFLRISSPSSYVLISFKFSLDLIHFIRLSSSSCFLRNTFPSKYYNWADHTGTNLYSVSSLPFASPSSITSVLFSKWSSSSQSSSSQSVSSQSLSSFTHPSHPVTQPINSSQSVNQSIFIYSSYL
jgi:hypothetical protein